MTPDSFYKSQNFAGKLEENLKNATKSETNSNLKFYLNGLFKTQPTNTHKQTSMFIILKDKQIELIIYLKVA